MKGEATAERAGEVRVDRERKILGILILSLGLLMAIGLVQHRNASTDDIRRFNSFLSRGLLGFFGFGAWILPVFLLRVGWNRLFGGTLRELLRSVVLFSAVLVAFSLLVCSSRVFGGLAEALGGTLGRELFRATDPYFGSLGSTLIGITFLLVVLTALYDITIPRAPIHDLGALLLQVPVRAARSALAAIRGAAARRTRPEAPVAEKEKPARKKKEKEAAPAAAGPLEETAAPPEAPPAVPAPERREEEASPIGPEGVSEEPDHHAGAAGPDGPVIHQPVRAEPTKEKKERKPRVRRGEKEFIFPPISLLSDPPENEPGVEEAYLRQQSAKLEEALAHFGVRARVVEVHPGPVITRFELEPAPGVKVQQIAGLADDLALALRAKRIRIVAPIPGKGAVGVEIPNPKPRTVYLKEVLTSTAYSNRKSVLTTSLGMDISGAPFCTSLEEMPHLLIAGATGSGKSVCIHGILTSLLYGATPEEVHLVLIDPKMLEMTVYNGIPHLLTPVVTDAKEAVRVLRWAVFEMERRYKLLARVGVRNIHDYNRTLPMLQASRDIQEEGLELEPLSYLVIVIDEFADLI
ncbi:MAG: DNA translocase FtsK, partial [Candidatus Latescibacterota bacterium]